MSDPEGQHVEQLLLRARMYLEQGNNHAAIEALKPRHLRILHKLAVRSGHPKNAAVAASIPEPLRVLDATIEVREFAGLGVEASAFGSVYRLGSRAFAAPDDTAEAAGDVVFAENGVVVAQIATAEVLRRDAAEEVAAL